MGDIGLETIYWVIASLADAQKLAEEFFEVWNDTLVLEVRA